MKRIFCKNFDLKNEVKNKFKINNENYEADREIGLNRFVTSLDSQVKDDSVGVNWHNYHDGQRLTLKNAYTVQTDIS